MSRRLTSSSTAFRIGTYGIAPEIPSVVVPGAGVPVVGLHALRDGLQRVFQHQRFKIDDQDDVHGPAPSPVRTGHRSQCNPRDEKALVGG